MHPPPFNPSTHLLSDWPECRIEVRCGCERMMTIPVQLLLDQHADQLVAPLARRMRCTGCQSRPAQVWLVAGNHRTCHGGPTALDWSVEIKVDP